MSIDGGHEALGCMRRAETAPLGRRARSVRRGVLLPAIAALALTLASCGDDGADDSAAGADDSAAPVVSDDACEAAVEEGGVVSLYSTMNTEVSPIVYGAFQETYPDLEVEQTRSSGDELIRKFTTEQRAGSNLADLLETNIQNIAAVIALGHTEPYVVENAVDFPDELHDKDGAWTATRRRTDVIAYNTDQLSEAEAPQTYEEIADPKWKDMLMVESTNVTDFTVLRHTIFGGDLDRAKEYWSGIEANDPFFNTGSEASLSLLIAGQKPIYVGAPGQDVVQAKESGAPVDYVKTEAVLDQAAVVLAKNAPHPNAARCYLEWIASADGQRAVLEAGYIPASSEVSAGPELDPPGITWYTYIPEYAETYDEDSQAWTEIFGAQ